MQIRPSLLLPSLLLILLIGCDDSEPRDPAPPIDDASSGTLPFSPPEFEEGRSLDTIIGLNLDDDPDIEQIVASLGRERSYPSDIRADRLDIYDLDARGEWREVARDSAFWFYSWSVRDLTGDEIPEFIAETWGGGNDEVAGRGISILSGHGGKIRTIFQRSGGAPEIVDVDGKPLLLISSLFWPEFLPHAAAVPIVEEVLTFDGAETRSDYEVARSYYQQESEQIRRELEKLIGEYGAGNESGPPSVPPAEIQGEIFSLTIRLLKGLNRGEESGGLESFRKETVPRLTPLLEEEQMMMIDDELYGP